VGRENPRTPAPPLYSSTVARVRRPNNPGQALDLCFGVGHMRGFFLTQPEIRSHEESNPGPEDHLNHLARGNKKNQIKLSPVTQFLSQQCVQC